MPVLLMLLAAGCTSEAVSSLASQTGPAPEQDVELIVDGLGITHVYAQSDADAFFGAGYAMARDRLFQMELTRRQALGRLAEIFGTSAYNGDVGARAIGFGRLGEADEKLMRAELPDQAALLDAWTEGINLRISEIASGKVPRPYGFRETELDFVPEPWLPSHGYAVGKVLVFGSSNSLDREILATALYRLAAPVAAKLPVLQPTYDTFIMPDQATPSPLWKPPSGPYGAPLLEPALGLPQMPSVYHRIAPPMGSNNWAVAGAHSENGRPLLAGDPHQSLTSPTRFWPFHMSSADAGGTLDVIGFSFVGTPTVELGHNRHIGWTATTNFADVMDIWDVEVSQDFSTITLGGQSLAVTSRTETILVRQPDSKVGTNEEMTADVYEVPGYGILVPDELLPVPRSILANGRILLNWTGFEPSDELNGFLGLDRATDLDAFEAAVDTMQVGAMNFIAASTQGISYRVHTRIPDRGDPAARPMPWRILTDIDGGSLWTRGDLPPNRLPNGRDPAKGFLFTANNDPWGFTADGNLENDPFYYGAFYDKGFRAQRLEERLTALVTGPQKATVADMVDLQTDTYSLMAETVVPMLSDAVSAIGTDPALAPYVGRTDLIDLAGRLAAWDRRFTRDKAEPVLFLGLEWFATKRCFDSQLPPALFEPIATESPQFFVGLMRNVLTGRFAEAGTFLPNGAHSLLLASLDDTVKWIEQRFGSAPFTMEQIHAAEFATNYGGDLLIPLIPVDGSLDTVNVSPAPFFKDAAPLEQFASTEMALYRMVVSFADDGTPEALVNFGQGTSGEPDSPHFSDQQQAWSISEYKALPFRRADVEAQASDRVTLAGRGK